MRELGFMRLLWLFLAQTSAGFQQHLLDDIGT